MKPSKRVVFAGKEFILNEETGQLEIVEKKATACSHFEQSHADENP